MLFQTICGGCGKRFADLGYAEDVPDYNGFPVFCSIKCADSDKASLLGIPLNDPREYSRDSPSLDIVVGEIDVSLIDFLD